MGTIHVGAGLLILLAILSGCSLGRVPEVLCEESDSVAESHPYVFHAEVRSRGRGVPEPARQALRNCRQLVEDARVKNRDTGISISESRIGLEGETRLRVEFTDPAVGQRVYAQISECTQGIDLFNLEVVGSPRQEE